MAANEFKKGEKFNFNESIDYAENAVVSKHILKKTTEIFHFLPSIRMKG